MGRSARQRAESQGISHGFVAMGGPCELRLYGLDRAAAAPVAASVEAEVRRLEARYSRYRPDSVTARINASAGTGVALRVDAETAALLDYAHTAWEHSEGLFDITSGVLRRAWDFKRGVVPTQEAVDALLPLVGWHQVGRRGADVLLPRAGMELDFGGYVKEYAADRAAAVATSLGAAHGFVELAGDIAVIGPHPDGSPLVVGIRSPLHPRRAAASVPLRFGAMASSGTYERFIEQAGRRYCHILDPRTGWPIGGDVASVSVVARSCLIAGTATTIALLKGHHGAIAWLEDLGLPYLLIDRAGCLQVGRMEHHVPA